MAKAAKPTILHFIRGYGVARAEEQRTEERVPAAFRVDLGGVEGTTRDVSASGLYFEAPAAFAPGAEIAFAIDIQTAGGAMLLACRGRVTRVERRGALQGVGVRIVESTLRAKTAIEAVRPA